MDVKDQNAEIEEGKLLKALKENASRGAIPFHMPGHKRNGKFVHLMGAQKFDVTEIEGFDDLHAAKGLLKEMADEAAEVFGVCASRILVGGSTAGILATVRALTKAGDGILIARNCHRSVYNAAELCDLKPYYVMPERVGSFFGEVTRQAVESALDAHPDVKLAVVVSPTYEGVISDIDGIAEACRSRRVKLFVDCAHGAHLGFGGFADGPCAHGADVATRSLHKTLPALTQTAVLNVANKAIPLDRIDEQLAVFESSSPSYVLMASAEGAIGYLKDREGDVKRFHDAVERLRRELAGLRVLKLYNGEGAYGYDVSKIVILTDGSDLSGVQLKRILRERFDIELEMAGVGHAIAMTGAGDDDKMYAALKNALFAIDDEQFAKKQLYKQENTPQTIIKNGENENRSQICGSRENSANGAHIKGFHTLRKGDEGFFGAESEGYFSIPEQALTPGEAARLATVKVPFEAALGEVCGENIWAYPPGCPIVARGERIDEATLDIIAEMIASGVEVQGSRGDLPSKISIIALPLDKRRI